MVTFHVCHGGVAFGTLTSVVFNSISAAEGKPTVVSAPSVNTSGTITTGTLAQVVGCPQINVVNFAGVQVGFSTVAEFTGDGYVPFTVIMIP